MTLRTFELIGATYTDTVTGTITINGVEVFNGSFTLNPDPSIQASIAEGEIELADDTEITVPVNITLSEGEAGIGMIKWNYLSSDIPNPVYPAEQYEILINPATPKETAIQTIQLVANPPLSDSDITILETTTNTTEILAIEILHNCTANLPNPNSFGYGRSSEMSRDNRNLIEIDGSAIADPDYIYIRLQSGQTLTFDQIIFPKWDI